MALFSLFGPPDIEKLKARHDVQGLIKAMNYPKDGDIELKATVALGEIGDAQAFEPLCAALKTHTLYHAATVALGKIGDARAVEPLCAVLTDSNKYVRQAAASALGKIGDARAVEPLCAALTDSASEVRSAAASALGKIGDVRAVEPLCTVLTDSSEFVRQCAASALGKIGGAQAFEPLCAALTDSANKVRQAVTEALSKMGQQAKIGQQAMESLIAALRDSSWRKREGTAQVLEALGWQPTDASQRAWYAVALQQWSLAITEGAAAVEPLIRALENPLDRHAKQDIIKALGNIGDAWAVELVGTALRNPVVRVRAQAVKVLGATGGARAVDLLCGVLRDSLLHWEVTEAFSKIGQQAMEPLIAALRDSDWEGCEGAAQALKALGWQPTDASQRAWYAVALQQWSLAITEGAAAVEPLIRALESLRDKEGVARDPAQSAVAALGEIGDARAVEPLCAVLTDSNVDVFQAAVVALGEIGDARAVEPLCAVLTDSNVDVLQAAVVALGEIGDARAVQPLIASIAGVSWYRQSEAQRVQIFKAVQALEAVFLRAAADIASEDLYTRSSSFFRLQFEQY